VTWKFDDGDGMYDVAQICLKGHVTNDSTQQHPQANKKFCPQCGSETITGCRHCEYPIRGDYMSDVVVVVGVHYKPPAYCENCGKPYPWTERAISEARRLAKELPGLTDEEKSQITESLGDLVTETDMSKSAARRVRNLLTKAGGEAAGMLRDIVVAVSSETAKKILLGQ